MHEREELECVISALTIINSAYIMKKIFRKNEINAVIEWLCKAFYVSPINKITSARHVCWPSARCKNHNNFCFHYDVTNGAPKANR